MLFGYHDINPPETGENLILIYLMDSSDSSLYAPCKEHLWEKIKGRMRAKQTMKTRVPIVILLYPIPQRRMHLSGHNVKRRKKQTTSA